MDWDYLWLDINLATMNKTVSAPYGAIENGALAVKNGKIAWIGTKDNLPEFDVLATPIYQGKGAWVTPGLIDAHTHLIFAGSRADEFAMRQQGMSYEQIAKQGGGILKTVQATRAASEAELFDLGRKRLNALAKEGVTTVEIKSGYGLDTDTELKMLRVARELNKHHHIEIKTSFLGAHTLPPEFSRKPQDYLDLVINKMLPQIIEHNLADAVDVFCEKIAFNLKQTEQVLVAAKNAGLAIKLHAEQLSNLGGAKLAAELGAISVDHLEYLDESGIQAMAKTGTCAVLLPGAFYFLQETKLPPVALLRQYQIPIVLASDYNPGSSPFCSTLLMLNMGCVLFQLTPEEALYAVTVNAAKALGIEKQVGMLEVGMQADFCVWDIQSPAELSYGYGTNPCIQVVKKGQLIHQ